MKRTWGIDVLACTRCDGRMELISVIDDPAVASRILTHRGLPTRPPPRGPPWRSQVSLPFVQTGDAGDGVDPPAFDE